IVSMDWIAYPVAGLFSVLGFFCVFMVLIGLPGTWIMIGLAVIVELLDRFYLGPSSASWTFHWGLLLGCVACGIVGEVIETLTGAAGTKLGGGSRRGMIGAVVGGMLGAILFTPLIPIPLVGTLIGALIGTFVGAFLAERSRSDRDEPDAKADLKAA